MNYKDKFEDIDILKDGLSDQNKTQNNMVTLPTELTFGQKAVGLNFNPSGEDAVALCKKEFAIAIDRMNDFRNLSSSSQEAKRMASIAITELQTAQMWAVKALTWKD